MMTAVVACRQADIVLGDRTHTSVQDPQADVFAHIDLEQSVLESLDRTRHIALEDEVELGFFAFLHPLQHAFQSRTTPARCLLCIALARLALLCDLTCDAVLRDIEEFVSRARHRRQSEHQTGRDGPASLS